MLNAADYGTPQQRLRVIYLAAQSDFTLPTIPAVTHHVKTPVKPLKTPWGIFPVASRSTQSPHAQVCVGHAIDDLPQFDW